MSGSCTSTVPACTSASPRGRTWTNWSISPSLWRRSSDSLPDRPLVVPDQIRACGCPGQTARGLDSGPAEPSEQRPVGVDEQQVLDERGHVAGWVDKAVDQIDTARAGRVRHQDRGAGGLRSVGDERTPLFNRRKHEHVALSHRGTEVFDEAADLDTGISKPRRERLPVARDEVPEDDEPCAGPCKARLVPRLQEIVQPFSRLAAGREQERERTLTVEPLCVRKELAGIEAVRV